MKTVSLSKICLTALIAAPLIASASNFKPILTSCAQFTAAPSSLNIINLNTIQWHLANRGNSTPAKNWNLSGYDTQYVANNDNTAKYGWSINVNIQTPQAISLGQALQLVNNGLVNETGTQSNATCSIGKQTTTANINVKYWCTGYNCN